MNEMLILPLWFAFSLRPNGTIKSDPLLGPYINKHTCEQHLSEIPRNYDEWQQNMATKTHPIGICKLIPTRVMYDSEYQR